MMRVNDALKLCYRCCASVASIFVVAGALSLPAARAAPPADPLPSPWYSFDINSPQADPDTLSAAAILEVGEQNPLIVIPARVLFMEGRNDDLDALSASNALIPPDLSFGLLFSVDINTVGDVLPDAVLASLGFPYNVWDQAIRNQQAGDQYLSTALFLRGTGVVKRVRVPGGNDDNNVLARNNYDEGGTDFVAGPDTSGSDPYAGVDQDSVDATANLAGETQVYFSATSGSDSLSELSQPHAGSGANIFFFVLGSTDIDVYATFADLGLVQADDIDALLIFDIDEDGTFNGTEIDADQVLFSLAPGSPSLADLCGLPGPCSAADVFTVTFGQAPTVFASGDQLGLTNPQDNVDALDFVSCTDSQACVVSHAIQLMHGDFDGDADVDSEDLPRFEQCLQGRFGRLNLGCEPGDFDRDQDVDCFDWTEFAIAWTEQTGPSTPEACGPPVPALSEWGMAVTAILLLTLGTLVLQQTRRTSE